MDMIHELLMKLQLKVGMTVTKLMFIRNLFKILCKDKCATILLPADEEVKQYTTAVETVIIVIFCSHNNPRERLQLVET